MSRPLLMLGCVAIGGALGASARYGLSLLVAARFDGARWPATLIANLAGCLLIGILWRVMDHHVASPATRAFLVTGLLGAFTTYSTFGLDVLHLMDDRRTGLAIGYVAASVVAGLLLVRLGHDVTGAFLPEAPDGPVAATASEND